MKHKTHKKTPFIKKKYLQKNPSKKLRVADFKEKQNKTETRTLLSKKQSWEYLFCKECCAAYY